MNMSHYYVTYFTYLPYFAHSWQFPGEARQSCVAYSLPGRHFPKSSKEQEITSEGLRRDSALWTCGTCCWSCHFFWMVCWTQRSLRDTAGNTLCDQFTILPLSCLEPPCCSFSGTCCIADDVLQRMRRMSIN
jgi:hypothetical protein